MPRLGVGLAIVLGAICCVGQQSAIADPIDAALAIWSTVTATVAGKKTRRRGASQPAETSAQEGAFKPEPIPPRIAAACLPRPMGKAYPPTSQSLCLMSGSQTRLPPRNPAAPSC
jgi:hypothetical protein